MEYFELTMSKEVVKPIRISNLDDTLYVHKMNAEVFEKLEKLKVGYFSGVPDEEICDILATPTYLVSDTVKRLFELYQYDIVWKAIQLFPVNKACKEMPLYWVPHLPEIDCLHQDTKKYTSGTIKKLVLRKDKCQQHSVFRIGGILEFKVIISLPVAESLLRRRLYGIGLSEIEVR